MEDILKLSSTITAPTQKSGNQVLIIDDHVHFMESISLHLELCGYEILSAMNLSEAERVIGHNDVSVIISDFNFGKNRENGLMLLDTLYEINRSIPIIILTMHYDPSLILKSISCGIKGFMLKDNCYENILSAIQNINKGKGFLCANTIRLIKEFSTNRGKEY